MKTRMMLTMLTIAIFPVIFFSSCSKLLSFNVSYKIPRQTFDYKPTNYKSGEQLLYYGYISANLDSILNANGLSSGVVGNTTVTQCSITIDKPDSVTFGWLQYARGVISQNAESAGEQVGDVTVTDATAKTVNLTLNNTNIRPYLGSKTFYFRIFGVLNGAVPVTWVQMYIDGTLQMRLEPLN
ncbi:MAG: hypothetical protein WCK84_11630 [Bacteroidota bacterium]